MPRGAKAFRKAVGGGSKDEEPEHETVSVPAVVEKAPAAHQAKKEAAKPAESLEDGASGSGEEDQPKKETKGQMTQRHKREFRDLKEKIKKMGKKAKDEAEKLEKEMEKRHAEELAALESEQAKEEEAAAQAVAAVDISDEPAEKKKSKAQAKREKRLQEEAEREARIKEELANLGETERMIEEEKLRKMLLPLGLYIRDVPSDGHCLFRSFEDQLAANKDSAQAPYPVLRKMCADYMRAHRDDFLPFLDLDEESESEGEDTGDRPELTPEQRFEGYCTKMETKAVWGGQLEVRALAQALKRHVIVYAADMPPLEMGEEFKRAAAPLRLTYHRHMYAMGEHYNSCRGGLGGGESEEESGEEEA